MGLLHSGVRRMWPLSGSFVPWLELGVVVSLDQLLPSVSGALTAGRDLIWAFPVVCRAKDLGEMVETVLGERSTEEDLRKLQRCIDALQCAR